METFVPLIVDSIRIEMDILGEWLENPTYHLPALKFINQFQIILYSINPTHHFEGKLHSLYTNLSRLVEVFKDFCFLQDKEFTQTHLIFLKQVSTLLNDLINLKPEWHPLFQKVIEANDYFSLPYEDVPQTLQERLKSTVQQNKINQKKLNTIQDERNLQKLSFYSERKPPLTRQIQQLKGINTNGSFK